MNAIVKIYGAPLVFDLYGGSAKELGYFQLFDNGSTDPEKLTIHRLSENQITYNYLRYGLITSGGRDGSFFGMSVIFNNCYCVDFKKISELFRAVYKTIVDKGAFFETAEQNSAQTKYKITKFSDAPEEVARIESILLKNIQNALADSIKALESNNSAQDDKEVQFNDNADNTSINEALRKYSIVSISPKYIGDGKPIDIIPPKIKTKINDDLNSLKHGVKGWIDDFRKFQSKVLTLQSTTPKEELKAVFNQEARPPFQKLVNDANGLKDQLRRIANVLSPYQDKKLSKEDNNYLYEREIAYGKRCEDLDYYVNELAGYNKLFAQGENGNGGGSEGNDGSGGIDGGKRDPNQYTSWELFFHKNKRLLLSTASILLALVILIPTISHFSKGSGNNPGSIEETQCDSIMKGVRKEMSANQWVKAYNHCKEITENEAYNGYGRLQDVTETMDLCRNNYKEYCLSQCVPENYAKKEDATQWFKKEMETVDCWDYSQEIQTIESRYPVAKLPQPTDSPGKKPSKNTESTTSKYTIVLYQDGQPITGKITKKKEITLKCLENGNKAVTVSNWKVGTSNKPDGKFTPQEKDKSFRISCIIKGKTVEKTIECDIQGGPGGTHM